MKNSVFTEFFIFLVAGARFERAYPGYEPGELPLLYPASVEYYNKKPTKSISCLFTVLTYSKVSLLLSDYSR